MKWNLHPNFTVDELKSEFRRLSKQYHPDNGGTSEEFITIHSQYQELKPRAVASRPKPPDPTKTYYRITSGDFKSPLTIYVPKEALEEGGTILHMFTGTQQGEQIQRLNIKAGTPSGASTKLKLFTGQEIVFVLKVEQHNLW
jgi:hypothetical protein